MKKITHFTTLLALLMLCHTNSHTAHAAPSPGDADYKRAEKLRLGGLSALHYDASQIAYTKACKLKSGSACWRLGLRLQASPNANKPNIQAKILQQFKRACTYRFPDGCAYAASHQLTIAKQKRQRRKARKLMRKACKQGSGHACYKLLKETSTRNAKQRLSLRAKRRWWAKRKTQLTKIHAQLHKSCRAGFETSCYLLGYLHYQGEPTKRPKQAVSMLTRACKLHSADACDFLALLHGNGLGVTKNLKRARQLHEKACKLHSTDGCMHFAGMVFRGLGGPKDLPTARDNFKRACIRNQPQACLLLGEMVIRGEGGPRKVYAAYRIYQRACKLGNKQACTRVTSLKPIIEQSLKKTKPKK